MKQVVLVTGGSSGIGKSICQFLASKGYTVYGSSRKAQNGDTLENFTLVGLDVTKPDTIKTAVDFIIAKENQIDILVNNAGLGIVGAMEDTTKEDVEPIFDTNFYGVMNVCTQVLPYMRKNKSGYVINISSIGGQVSLPFRGIYSASKFAVEAITESMSIELKPYNVKAVIVQPGDFNTNINATRKLVEKSTTSDYSEVFNRINEDVNDHVSSANDPIMVAKTVYKIVNTKKPALRYQAAPFMQKISIYVKRFIPGRAFEKMLMNHYNIK